MPKRTDLKCVLVLGSGPIQIGQACEFDYSGTQALKALREEGIRTVLLNSNPASIMTDPGRADATYIEPMTLTVLEKILEAEKPDAILPTVGGQTALNLAMEAHESGLLERTGVGLIGAQPEAIKRGEDRQLFKALMDGLGLETCRGGFAHNMGEARDLLKLTGFPAIIRPSFTLGGSGGGIAYNVEEFETIVARGLDLSPTKQVLIEESILGWKEFELEVVRDLDDNVEVICSIENFDPMGVHTGDSITVAPALTLTDPEYQRMRDASLAVIRAVGVETGGSNIQFALEPETSRIIVIEMNPRVSRSSALASKATGFPIAWVATKLALGYRLWELPNAITRMTKAAFEPVLDYIVVKIPRFTFEKFPKADPTLTSQMKSVGEAMAIGRTFKQALQKALRSLETGRSGLGCDAKDVEPRKEDGSWDTDKIEFLLRVPNAERIFAVRHAFLAGITAEKIHEISAIDPWFLDNIQELVETELSYRANPSEIPLRQAKKLGFSDRQLAHITDTTEDAIRAKRKAEGIEPTYRLVDTCAAEFEATTPYFYSTYGDEDETRKGTKKKVMILGGGPNRIGQGIEFDYCCVHAAFALKEEGWETIMVNSNPETVSTDYDTSDKLFFEPLTLEDVLNIYEREQCDAAVVQFGGQTPLNLAAPLQARGVTIIGTQPKSIEMAEDRKHFAAMIDKLKLRQTTGATAIDEVEAVAVANKVGYPVLVRPSFVLGGRAMEIVYTEEDLRRYIRTAVEVSPERPVLVDRFLEDATEVDVDCLADGTDCVIGGIMEHIEEAGIHSGDSACVLPSVSLSAKVLETIRSATKAMALELDVRGLMNVQYAVKDEEVYVLEVNPRASRTSPFVSKAIGVPLAKMAAKIMAGRTLKELGFTKEVIPTHFSVKEAVFPFIKFPGIDIILGPEMRSTGEVMGIDTDFPRAYAKAQMAAAPSLPSQGNLFVSVKDSDKKGAVAIVKDFAELGFKIHATDGTASLLKENGIAVTRLNKLAQGRPNVVDMIKNGEMQFIINTPSGKQPRQDEVVIRSTAVATRIPIMTTLRAAAASVSAIQSMAKKPLEVKSLQEYHATA